ncbi:MAG: NfeD family protein [Planctomycetota bacterium]|nr:NfeD family protein [Planctomycetota bacterium]
MIEILVIPGFGFIGGIGLILVIYSLFAAFIPGIFPIDGPSPFDSHYSGLGRAGQAFLALLVSFVLMGVGGFIISKFLPGMPLLKNLVHSGSASDSSYQSVSEKTQELVGKTGMALTELRPTGRVEIDDDIYDAQSEGGFLDKGSKVKVVRVSFSLIVEEA